MNDLEAIQIAGYSHQSWSCPFFVWDERLAVHCECGRLRFPDWEARSEYTNAYCAGDATSWKRCTAARNMLLYYERTEADEADE